VKPTMLAVLNCTYAYPHDAQTVAPAEAVYVLGAHNVDLVAPLFVATVRLLEA